MMSTLFPVSSTNICLLEIVPVRHHAQVVSASEGDI